MQAGRIHVWTLLQFLVMLTVPYAPTTAAPAIINPKAYGVKAGNTAAQNDAGLARLFEHVSSGSTILFSPGTYQFSRIMHPAKQLKIVGSSPIENGIVEGTVLSCSDTPCLEYTDQSTSRYSILQNVMIKAAPGGTGILVANLGLILLDVFVDGGARGVEIQDMVGTRWENVVANGSEIGIYVHPTGSQAVNQNTLISVATSSGNGSGAGVILTGEAPGSVNSNIFIGLDAENCGRGFVIDNVGPFRNTFVNIWGEANHIVNMLDDDAAESVFINPHFDGSSPITFGTRSLRINGGQLVVERLDWNIGTAFAELGSPPPDANGRIQYCSDCTITSVCASGGTGAIAKRLNGVWICN